MQALLTALLSPDNVARQAATTSLQNAIKGSSNQVLKEICAIVKCPDDAISTLSLVILKQYYLTPKDLSIQPVCITLSPGQLQQLLTHLTQCLSIDKPQSFNRKLIDILANISDTLNKNSELLQFLSTLESKVFTMYGIQILVERFLNDTFAHQHSASFLQILKQGLDPNQKLEVRIAALKATCEFLLAINEDKVIHQFISLLPVLINTLVEALKHDEDSGNEVLSSLIDLTTGHAEIWQASIEELIEIATQIADVGAGFEEGTRQQAVELISTLTEEIPKLMRKSHNMETKFIPVLFQMISQPQFSEENEQEEWNKDTTESQVADISKKDPHSVGKAALTKIGDVLGEKVFMKMSAALMQQGMSSQDWKVRSGCILASGIAAESCKDFYTKNLENVIQTLAPFLNDSNHRNRFASITSLSFVCQSTSPQFQKLANVEYLEKLCSILNQDPFTKNRLQATSGMIDFCRGILDSNEEDDEQQNEEQDDGAKQKKTQSSQNNKKKQNLDTKRGINIIKSVADPLLKAIASSLSTATQNSLTRLQQELLNLISLIASVIDTAFLPYFNQLSTGITKLYEIVPNHTPEGKSVKSKVIVTLATMLSSLHEVRDSSEHPEVKEFAINFLNMIMELKQSNKSDSKDKIKDDDPQLVAITQAFIHLADFLKEQMLPCLPQIIPSLLHDLELDIDFKVQNAEIDALIKKDPSSISQHIQGNQKATAFKTVQIKGMEESIKMSLNTHAFQQKEQAASAILGLCQSLGEYLGHEYAQNILPVVVKYLDFPYSKKIRKSTTKTLKFVLKVPKTEQERSDVFINVMYPKLKAVLANAVDKNNLQDSKLLFKEISRCVQTFPTLAQGNSVVPLDQQKVEEMYQLMTKSFNGVNKINQQLINSSKGDMDQEDAEELLQEIQENSNVVSFIMDLSGHLLKRYGDKIDSILTSSGLIDLFLDPLFQKIPSSKALLDPLCFIGQTMENCSLQTFEVLAGKTIARLFEVLTEFGDEDIDIQQNVSFIMGIIAKRANESQFKPMAEQVISRLVKMITDINAMTTDERIIATETAVGALGKVILFQTTSEYLNDEIVKNMYLNYLPLKAEEEEALNAHDLFFNAIVSGHSVVEKNRKECGGIVERMIELCQGSGQEDGNELKDEIYTEKMKAKLMKCHQILGN